MNTLSENRHMTYKGHTIQEMEDWEGLETLFYVDGSIITFSLREAKRVVNDMLNN